MSTSSASAGVSIDLRADDHLELNISHALLHTLMQAVPCVSRCEQLPHGWEEEWQASIYGAASARLHAYSQVERGPRVVSTLLNRTGLPLTVSGALVANAPAVLHVGSVVTLDDGAGSVQDDVAGKGSGGASSTLKPDMAEYATTRLNPMLAAACQSGDQVLVRLLLERNANPNSASARGSQKSALQIAAKYARLEIAAQLIDARAFLEARVERTGNRALHLAALSGSVQMVELLLERRADPCAVNAHGQTAWSYAQNALSKRKVCLFLPDGTGKRAPPRLSRAGRGHP